jgi:hypothetical protein
MQSPPSGDSALQTISSCAASVCVIAPSPIHQEKPLHLFQAARPAGDLHSTLAALIPAAPQLQTKPSLSPPLTALRV